MILGTLFLVHDFISYSFLHTSLLFMSTISHLHVESRDEK